MAIKRVSALSTGTVWIHPQHAASHGSPIAWWLATSRRWTEPLPISLFAIEHDQGLVLFDTGQDRRSVTDPDYFPGGLARLIYRRLARFEIGPDDTLTARLAGIGLDVADVRFAVLSHLHQDHIGGLRELEGAEIIVSEAEWATVGRPGSEINGILTRHIDLPGIRWRRVTPGVSSDPAIAPFTHAVDLFDDGSLLLLPTPGHTPGSLSMLLRDEGFPPMLFVGDLTYRLDLLEDGRIPGVGDAGLLRSTTAMVQELRRSMPDLVVLPAHDPGAAARLADAVGGRA
ncbi:N-acyl homoserine lactonase family protein [Microbacter sp. GSS18]|nr:N-acyl homoserine lactonase family protein [Microbacter sp. GSS18]